METVKLTYEIDGDNFSAAGEASTAVKRVLKKLKLPPAVVRRAVVCMYEGEINMVIHAHGGTVSVTVEPDHIQMILADTGPGIPAELRRTMFQRGISTKGRSRGTGLSLVREVVEAYHGEIRVESESGVGTSFFISFHREETPDGKE